MRSLFDLPVEVVSQPAVTGGDKVKTEEKETGDGGVGGVTSSAGRTVLDVLVAV